MPPFLESTTIIFFSPFVAGLLWVIFLASYSAINSIRQGRRIEGSRLASLRMRESQLTATLGQTLTDLSLQRRPAQWFDVQVVRIDQEAEDIKSFYLIDPSGESLPPYLAGQHLLIEMPKGREGDKQCRCYTISDGCHHGYWRFTVKRNSDTPTSVSRWLHDEVQRGDLVRVRGPSGSFILRSTTNRHVVLISAGIGITPMLSMMHETLRRPHASLTMFSQFRDADHMPFAESLLNVASQHSQACIRVFLSSFPRGVTGSTNGLIQQGKFGASDICSQVPSLREADFYLCGPESWQNDMRAGLLNHGVPEDQIYFEFFQQSEKAQTAATRPIIESCSVHFRQSNKLAAFAASYPNLLGFAIKSDVSIDRGCGTGACGSCMVRLLQGKVRYTRRPQYPLKSNEILPCVCVPDGDIVLDA